jgi:glucose 1-dehydrogenase
MQLLANRVAVITGGTRGLGLAIARALAAEGTSVVLGSRTPQAVADAVRALQAAGAEATGLALDVADLAQVQALARHALATYGHIDIWVNAAGIAGSYGPTLGVDPQEFNQVIQTNIVGTYNGSRTALAIMMAQGSGKLINLLGMGYNSPPWQSAYGSSKSWVRAFTLALANETRGSGVGAFAFQPGMVLTDLLTNIHVIQGSEQRLKVFPTVVRILAQPPEVPARKAVWIASTATDGKTGLIVKGSTPGMQLGGALRELWRAIRGNPASDMGIRVQVIPPFAP